QLQVVALVRADEQVAEAARLALPEAHDLGRLDDPHDRRLVQLRQGGERHAEGLGHLAQGAEARVGAGLLEVHEHALAHAAAGGELVEAPPPGGPEAPDVASDRRGDGFSGGHRLTVATTWITPATGHYADR